MPLKSKEQQKEYQKNWIRQRRQDWIDSNGPCAKCKTWKDLEIDHIDPSTKTMQISQIWSRKQEVRDEELAKCQVLCEDCHKEKTKSEQITKTHGTYAMRNNHNCTCEKCLEYVRVSKQAWRLKTGKNKTNGLCSKSKIGRLDRPEGGAVPPNPTYATWKPLPDRLLRNET